MVSHPFTGYGNRAQDRPHFEELQELLAVGDRYDAEHESEKAYAAYRALEARGREINDPHWIRIALVRQAGHYFHLGNTERATELDRQVLHYLTLQEELEGRKLDVPRILTYANIITGYKTQGNMGEAYQIQRHFEDFVTQFYLENLGTDISPDPPFIMLEIGTRFWYIGAYLDHEAGFRFEAGDTEGALAIFAGYIANMESDPIGNRPLVTRPLSSAYGHQISRLERVGRYEEAAVFSEKLLAMEDTPATSLELHRERVRSSYRRLRQGEEPLQLLKQAEEALDVLRDRNHLHARIPATSEIARMHFHMGNVEKALGILDELIDETRGLTLNSLLARLLLTRAELLLESGVALQAEEDLIEALSLLRQQGHWRREAEGYALYARFLVEQERTREAGQIIGRGKFLAREFNEPVQLERLLALQEEINPRVRADDEPHNTAPFDWSDLQPLQMKTEVGADELARGRFVVTNFGAEPVEGTISVAGPIGGFASNGERRILAVEIDPTSTTQKLEHDVSISSGDTWTVFLEASLANGHINGDASISWESTARQDAYWEYSSTEANEAVSIVTSSVAMENPFYPVPLYHEIYYRGDTPVRKSIRVKTSHPSRVEFVDHLSGDLLAVDATGDGDFSGPGDVIFRDSQRNGFPDIGFDPENDFAALLLFVFPNPGIRDGDDLTLQVETLEDGVWRPAGMNHFLLMQDNPSNQTGVSGE